MSRMTITGGVPPRGKDDPLTELDIDELVERLTPGEIQKLLDECDPDDPHIPPGMRTNYKVGRNQNSVLFSSSIIWLQQTITQNKSSKIYFKIV